MAHLNLRGINKRFGKNTVIHDVDLNIKHGEFVVFVGPSGCGKSTLLRLVAGLEEVSSGDIFIDSEQVNDHSPSDRGIAMVFQSYALYPHMSVRQNMAFGLEVAKVPANIIEEKVSRAAGILELGELLERKPKQLSGGQRQRVAIGRAIVRDPKVFLFDEPLSNLDAKLRVQMRVEITKLHKQLGNTMIYVTHDQVEAMTMADKIVVLNAGRIEQVGSPLELYHAPANKFVAGFIGSPRMNFIPVEVIAAAEENVMVKLGDGQTLSLSADSEGLQTGDKLELGVRPEHMLKDTESDVQLILDVDMREYLGSNSHYYCSYGDCSNLTVTTDGQLSLEELSQLYVGVQLENLHLFNDQGKSITSTEKLNQLARHMAAA